LLFKQRRNAGEQPAPLIIGIGNALIKVNAVRAVQVFGHHLPDLVIIDCRDQRPCIRRAAAVGDLLPAFQLAAHMVVNVLIADGYQRRCRAGGVPVLAGNRSRRVGEIVGGADGYTFCFLGVSHGGRTVGQAVRLYACRH